MFGIILGKLKHLLPAKDVSPKLYDPNSHGWDLIEFECGGRRYLYRKADSQRWRRRAWDAVVLLPRDHGGGGMILACNFEYDGSSRLFTVQFDKDPDHVKMPDGKCYRVERPYWEASRISGLPVELQEQATALVDAANALVDERRCLLRDAELRVRQEALAASTEK